MRSGQASAFHLHSGTQSTVSYKKVFSNDVAIRQHVKRILEILEGFRVINQPVLTFNKESCFRNWSTLVIATCHIKWKRKRNLYAYTINKHSKIYCRDQQCLHWKRKLNSRTDSQSLRKWSKCSRIVRECRQLQWLLPFCGTEISSIV